MPPQHTKTTPLDAFRRARKLWLKGEKISLAALADDLHIGRATLFRWVGNRDLLIAEILWSLYEPLYKEARAQTPGQGIDYIVGVYRHINLTALHFKPLRKFLHQDPEYALKMLTSVHSTLHTRTVELNTRLLKDEIRAGHLSPPMNVQSLSYFMIRIAESCLYSDIIGGHEPREDELEDGCTAVRILLGGRI